MPSLSLEISAREIPLLPPSCFPCPTDPPTPSGLYGVFRSVLTRPFLTTTSRAFKKLLDPLFPIQGCTAAKLNIYGLAGGGGRDILA